MLALCVTGAGAAGVRAEPSAGSGASAHVHVVEIAAAPAVDETSPWRRRLLLAAAVVATLVTVVLLVHMTRGQRTEPSVERRRGDPRARSASEAMALVGNALAATHDPHALLPVILEAAIEATGAIGGRLVDGRVEIARRGETTTAPLRLPLAAEGTDAVLEIHPEPSGFSPEQQELARWLAAQASIALENARLHRIVQRQAVTDELTGLANRRRFMDALETEIDRTERLGGGLAVLISDLDDFKIVNDSYGHQAGDHVLRVFATVLSEHVREVDTVARLGGEEFAIILPETDADGVAALGERLREALRRARVVLDDTQIAITASFGAAEYVAGESADELLSRADVALYRAKAAGKDRVVLAV